MKLYNLFQNVILDEIIKKIQILEGVSHDVIDKVIDGDSERQGKFYKVNIRYRN